MLKHCSQSAVDVKRRSLRKTSLSLESCLASSICLLDEDEQSLEASPLRTRDDSFDRLSSYSSYCSSSSVSRSVCTLPRQPSGQGSSLQSIAGDKRGLARRYMNGLLNTVTIKVYADCLRPDLEYKTMTAGPSTTSKQIILTLLGKFKMKHRDPKLFYLTMEVTITLSGSPVVRVIILEDEARPAELVSCNPWGNLRFRLRARKGGLVRVYDSVLMKESQYKCLLISEQTTARDVVKILLNCYGLSDSQADEYCLYQRCPGFADRKVGAEERPLDIAGQWADGDTSRRLVLRRDYGTPAGGFVYRCQVTENSDLFTNLDLCGHTDQLSDEDCVSKLSTTFVSDEVDSLSHGGSSLLNEQASREEETSSMYSDQVVSSDSDFYEHDTTGEEEEERHEKLFDAEEGSGRVGGVEETDDGKFTIAVTDVDNFYKLSIKI